MIAGAERDLLLTAAALMLIVVVPVFLMCVIFVRRFGAASTQGPYLPDWSYSKAIDATIWMVPAALVLSIGYLVWTRTHQLDPYSPVAGSGAPLEIDVIAQDWKWLFLYPDRRIAAVNELAFPAGRPITLKLTSDASMNSLLIAGLVGQIYVMAGMQTQLNFVAPAPAQFVGRNTQFNGAGFADQHFKALAMTEADFDAWAGRAQAAPRKLDPAAYTELSKPSSAVPVTYYAGYEPDLFGATILKYEKAPPPKSQPSVTTPAPPLKRS